MLKWELILIFIHEQAEISIFSECLELWKCKSGKTIDKINKTAHSFFANNSKYHKDSKNSTQERKNYIYPKIKWVNLELLFWGGESYGTWKNLITDNLPDKNDRNIGAFSCHGNYLTHTCWSSLRGRTWRWTYMIKYNIIPLTHRSTAYPYTYCSHRIWRVYRKRFAPMFCFVFLSIVSWCLLEQIFNQSICLHMLCKWNQRDIFILHSVSTSLTKCKSATPHC